MLDNLPVVTDAVQRAICNYIRYGLTRESAAMLAGVSPRSVCHWMECGQQGTEPHVQFRHAVLTAEAKAEARMVSILFHAAKKNAAYARWWLERKRPTRWSSGGRRLARLEKVVEQLVGTVRAKH